ncbi:GNAT family N-acetyltransferase [Massilia yuzhufengensis]|uniref:Ribosomal protein S18 acetylase RimI n=1 Tax=Massilia yuzhufengensis TaxID=1164594 RepID=A0A1I1VS02_9BURK|nr:GNAT family N-acetyltransferase [Massilia yuzhufengensis]SFD85625.1 Ribosomal protein S18 acetylase RimI [Massilia yuzhufengensis]
MQALRFAPVQNDPATLATYGALFAACFPGTDKFTPAYLDWLYVANPDGAAVGYDAWDGERLAAHYVCIPARAWVEGVEVRVLLSLNTATHPDYQGKGLFTKLAAMTYEAGAAQGFDGCYGVANANSTPGFVRKLGFQLVRPLEARVGLGRLRHGAKPEAASLSFERAWSPQALAWRCANPHNRVWQHAKSGRTQFHAAAVHHVPAYAELDGAAAPAQAGERAASPVRLFIGLAPDATANYWNYASIPLRLRPSPLNLIWRGFTPRVPQLDAARIQFTFLDFDAY